MTRRNPHLATMYFHDDLKAHFFAMRMNGDVTHVQGNFPFAVTFDVRQF